jgi:hypothetical protein
MGLRSIRMGHVVVVVAVAVVAVAAVAVAAVAVAVTVCNFLRRPLIGTATATATATVTAAATTAVIRFGSVNFNVHVRFLNCTVAINVTSPISSCWSVC